jgi:hypothetical protein
MSKRRNIPVLAALACILLGLSLAWGQDVPDPQEPGINPESPTQQPVPAFGPETPVPSVDENPPITGLDIPNLQPHAAPLSYLQAGAHASESADSNAGNSLGGSQLGSITRAEGSLELKRLWSHYDLSLDYLGGIGYYNVQGIGLKQIEELGMEQKITWKRGELNVRDAFSYQPEGTFGGSYGSVSTTGAGLEGDSTFFGGTGLGALGLVPRIMNLTLVDMVENLTPKSSLTLTGGYGFVHFLGNDPDTGTSFIGNSQVSGELGYSRIISPHDQAAILYGYQSFQFSTGITFHSHVIQAMWGHRITGRMDFLVGVGPQFTQLNHIPTPVLNPIPGDPSDKIPPCSPAVTSVYPNAEICPLNNLKISVAGRGMLRYQFPKTSLALSYDHFLTNGSGFFAGAESDIARLSLTRPLGRIWTVFSDLGYSRNSREIPLTIEQLTTCKSQQVSNNGITNPACPGVAANTYQYGFAGAGLQRRFGRTLHAFGSYEFNNLSFDNSYCGSNGPCNRISHRNTATVGIDWTPRPVRLD